MDCIWRTNQSKLADTSSISTSTEARASIPVQAVATTFRPVWRHALELDTVSCDLKLCVSDAVQNGFSVETIDLHAAAAASAHAPPPTKRQVKQARAMAKAAKATKSAATPRRNSATSLPPRRQSQRKRKRSHTDVSNSTTGSTKCECTSDGVTKLECNTCDGARPSDETASAALGRNPQRSSNASPAGVTELLLGVRPTAISAEGAVRVEGVPRSRTQEWLETRVQGFDTMVMRTVSFIELDGQGRPRAMTQYLIHWSAVDRPLRTVKEMMTSAHDLGTSVVTAIDEASRISFAGIGSTATACTAMGRGMSMGMEVVDSRDTPRCTPTSSCSQASIGSLGSSACDGVTASPMAVTSVLPRHPDAPRLATMSAHTNPVWPSLKVVGCGEGSRGMGGSPGQGGVSDTFGEWLVDVGGKGGVYDELDHVATVSV